MTGPLLKPGPRWWRRVVQVVAWFALAAMAVLYLNYLQHESDRRWCRLLVVLTTDSPAPTTQRGREIAEIMEGMKSDFRCN